MTVHARPSRQTAFVVSPRFQGVIDEAQLNQQRIEQEFQRQLEPRRQEVLKSALLTVGEKQYKGIDLLRLVNELADENSRQYVRQEKLMDILYPQRQRSGAMLSSLDKVMKTLVDVEVITKTYLSWATAEVYVLTPIGKTILSGIQRNGSISAPMNPRLEKLRYLTAGTPFPGFNSGWALLRDVSQKIKGYRAFYKLFTQGIREQDLLRLYAGNDSAKADQIKRQLDSLRQFNLLLKEPNRENPGKSLWLLSQEGIQALSKNDIVQALNISHEDMKALIQLEIDRLDMERKQREDGLRAFESEFRSAYLLFEALQNSGKIATEDAKSAYQSFKAAQGDEDTLAGLERDAINKTLAAEHLQEQIAMEGENLKWLKKKLDSAKNFQVLQARQTNQSVQRLMKVKLQLQANEMARRLDEAMGTLESVTSQHEKQIEQLGALFSDLLTSIDLEHSERQQKTQEIEEKVSLSMKADQVCRTAYMEEALDRLVKAQAVPKPAEMKPDTTLKVDDPAQTALLNLLARQGDTKPKSENT